MSSSRHLEPGVKENNHFKLKPRPAFLPSRDPSCRSDDIHPSAIPSGKNPRSFYLGHVHAERKNVDTAVAVPPPLISASPFIPKALISLVMRRKKNSALGVKYVKGDSITDMEGALHTFINPVVPRCEMTGDYAYTYTHTIVPFGSTSNPHGDGKVLLTRSVAMSALIQPDFESPLVMLRVCKLDADEIIGEDFHASWEECSVLDKQDDHKRAVYDAKLRRHMIFHLTSSHRIPARRSISQPMSVDKAISLLEFVIKSPSSVDDQLVNRFMQTQNNSNIISLELLYNTAVQLVLNEISALEALFPQGYVYTYDPPSIFARTIGASILNRLFLSAIKKISSHNIFTHLKTFAVNDYADKNIVDLLRYALAAQSSKMVRCVPKRELFKGNGGLYSPTIHERGAILVVHNNSDAFGQNIETEWMTGSLDGAIGATSSAAASLKRNRTDLLDYIF